MAIALTDDVPHSPDPRARTLWSLVNAAAGGVLGLLVGVQLAGLWGALFGVPILAVIVILVNHWLDIYSPEQAALADLAEAEHRHEVAKAEADDAAKSGEKPEGGAETEAGAEAGT